MERIYLNIRKIILIFILGKKQGKNVQTK